MCNIDGKGLASMEVAELSWVEGGSGSWAD